MRRPRERETKSTSVKCLTQARRKLFNSALKLKKDLKFNYISTSNGRIYLRKNNSKDSPHIQINSESDLAKLRAKEQHPTASIPSRDRGQRHGSEPWLTQALEAQIGLGKESATPSTAKPGIANNKNDDEPVSQRFRSPRVLCPHRTKIASVDRPPPNMVTQQNNNCIRLRIRAY